MKRIWLIVLCGLALVRPVGGGEWQAKRVVIVVIDGLRWVDGLGDPRHANVPRLAGELVPRGTLFVNFRNEGRTETCPGHAAIVTGSYQSIANDGSELPLRPTILQRYLAQSAADPTQAWLISGKDKLRILLDCQDEKWRGKHLAASYCGLNDGKGRAPDPAVGVKVREVLSQDHPHLVVVNLPGVDAAGHAGKREGYEAAIRVADQAVADLAAAIAADPAGRAETDLFITNDHGRHADGVRDGFVNHGCGCEGCRHIMLLAIGPDFAAGQVCETRAGLPDLAATAAAILGFPLPEAEGRPLPQLEPAAVQ